MRQELLCKYLCYLPADKFMLACHRIGTFKRMQYYRKTFCPLSCPNFLPCGHNCSAPLVNRILDDSEGSETKRKRLL